MKALIFGSLVLLSMNSFAAVLKHPTCIVDYVVLDYQDDGELIKRSFEEKGYVLNLQDTILSPYDISSDNRLVVSVPMNFSSASHRASYMNMSGGVWAAIENALIRRDAYASAHREGHWGRVSISNKVFVPAGGQWIDHVNLKQIYKKEFRANYTKNLSEDRKAEYIQKTLELIPQCEIE